MITRRAVLGGIVAAAGSGYLPIPKAPRPPKRSSSSLACDVVIVGGGVGGVAAALAACRNGRSVVLACSVGMLGGQFTSQLVPPDEHRWIEASGGALGRSSSYADLRARVRASYKAHRPVTAAFQASQEANPGNAWVSRLSAEPLVWRNRIEDMLHPHVLAGRLTVLYGYRPVQVAVSGSLIVAVVLEHAVSASLTTVTCRFAIDASEEGDLLPLAGVPLTIGREADTGELHNTATTPNPFDLQAITWVAALGYDRTGDHRGPAPAGYSAHVARFHAFFAGHLFDPTRDWAWSEHAKGPNFWQYRRVIAQSSFSVPIEEVTLLNYHANDYLDGITLGVSAVERAAHLRGARSLTACLIHYLQNDIPRADGSGAGYRGLRLRPDIAGTVDGYAEAPYIREARRMKSIGRVWEWHVGVDARAAAGPLYAGTAYQFADAVGTGHYWIDVHAGPQEPNGLWRACHPYQVPFMALIPPNRSNLLAGGKALGVSHVTNGAYRLHPTEWATGEAAGMAAHASLAWALTPAQIRTSRMGQLQSLIRAQGGQTEWPEAIRSATQ